MKNLAFQLGESCLACDLPALINQKRDMEIIKITKKNLSFSMKDKQKLDYIDKLKNLEKIESDHEIENKISNRNTNNKEKNNTSDIKNLLNKKPLLKNNFKEDNNNINNNTTNNNKVTLNNILEYTKDFNNNIVFSFEGNSMNAYSDKNYKNYLKIREIISNFILSCLKEFTVDEYHLIKINTNLLYCFISLPSFDFTRKKLERKVKNKYLYYLNILLNLEIRKYRYNGCI
jgi:hypothetical protein